MARNLSPDEAALWRRVMDSVRPLRAAVAPASTHKPARDDLKAGRAEPIERSPVSSKKGGQPARSARTESGELARTGVGGRAKPVGRPMLPPPPAPAATLDGGWDRRLARGLVFPDVTVDLHGHTLHSAHDLLDAALARAIAAGDRVVLLVTGRPPRAESERPHARGAIRAAVGDWLAGSRHAAHIAAVRGAHPRHGGAGALYLILRRPRGTTS